LDVTGAGELRSGFESGGLRDGDEGVWEGWGIVWARRSQGEWVVEGWLG